LDPFVVEIVQVPMLPPFTLSPELHGAALVATGFGVAVVGRGVKTYVQGQLVTVVVVEPPTVAVKVATCPASTVNAVGDTVTVTTLALELPQPDITSAAPAAHTAKIEFLAIRQLMDEISLVNSPREFRAGPPRPFRFLKLVSLPLS
jgi:hypothetical protein